MHVFRRKVMGYSDGLEYREKFAALIRERGPATGVGLFCDLDASSLGTSWVMLLTPATPIEFEELSTGGWEPVEQASIESWTEFASSPHTAERFGIAPDGWIVNIAAEEARNRAWLADAGQPPERFAAE